MPSALGPLRGLNVCQALFTARELNWTRVLNTCFPPNRDVHSARTAFLEVLCEQFTATQRRCSQVVTPVQSRPDYTQTRDYSVQNFHFQCLKAPGSQNALARIVLPNLRSTPVASLLLRLHWLPVTSRKKIQTGNYYLQISSITNLPASATSAASTRSTTVRVVKCMCVCMEFSSVHPLWTRL